MSARFILHGYTNIKNIGLRQNQNEAVCKAINHLDTEQEYQVTIEPYKKRLPANLRSRIKILVRELAAFNGITYEEFNGIVHRLYYPKRDRVIAGQTIESSIPTNELTPDEARIIESELINLGATIGCPLSDPHQK